MVRIEQNKGVQKFGLTCSEAATIVTHFYLFVFTHLMTKNVLKTVLIDNSTRPGRYNLFKIDGNFFTYAGWYDLEVFEQTNGYNTEIKDAGKLVETARVFVLNTDTGAKYNETDLNTNFIEYAG